MKQARVSVLCPGDFIVNMGRIKIITRTYFAEIVAGEIKETLEAFTITFVEKTTPTISGNTDKVYVINWEAS